MNFNDLVRIITNSYELYAGLLKHCKDYYGVGWEFMIIFMYYCLLQFQLMHVNSKQILTNSKQPLYKPIVIHNN